MRAEGRVDLSFPRKGKHNDFQSIDDNITCDSLPESSTVHHTASSNAHAHNNNLTTFQECDWENQIVAPYFVFYLMKNVKHF